jgi:hypothetical protein
VRYANEDMLYRLLEVDPLTEDPDVLADIESVEEGIAANIDAKCNRTFGAAPLIEARDIAYHTASRYDYFPVIYTEDGLRFWPSTGVYGAYGGHSVYITPWGMKSVTAVSVDGTWNGATWDDEIALTVDQYDLAYKSTNARGWAYGLILPTTGYHSVRVTATWEDGSEDSTVPADIREAATFATADQYRVLHQSPQGEIGPVGLATFIRNVWEYDSVKTAIENHKFRQLVV